VVVAAAMPNASLAEFSTKPLQVRGDYLNTHGEHVC